MYYNILSNKIFNKKNIISDKIINLPNESINEKIIMKEGKIFIDQQVSGSCTFYSIFIFYYSYLELNNKDYFKDYFYL